MDHQGFTGRSARGETAWGNRLARAGIGVIGSVSATGLALALGWTGGCDPDPVPEPPCAFHSEVEIAGDEFVREPGNPWRTVPFSSEAGDHVLEFHLDGMPAADAIVDGEKLNLASGVSVQDEVVLRFELHLSAGLHELALRVAGPPGGRLRYTLARIIASDQPAITDNFTVYQGEASIHTLCGGMSSIAFASNALQEGDQELNITVHCEAAACVEGGATLASPRLVFDTPNDGYQFRMSPVLDHPTANSSVRELDGVPIAGEEVGTVVINGAEARILRSRIPHFSVVDDVDLDPWCEQELKQLGVPASDLCYSSGADPGMQYLVLCKSNGGETSASACGVGPDACVVGYNKDDYCNPDAIDCEMRAREDLKIDPCPPLTDDFTGSPSHSLRCEEFTNQVFVGEEDLKTGQCKLNGGAPLTRAQQVKTVLAATFGARFKEAVENYVTTNAECATRDFASEFVDYPTWESGWFTNNLKFAICVGVLRGREKDDKFEIAPNALVEKAEMAAMLVRVGGLEPLGLPDNTLLEPHPRMVDLHQHYNALVDELAPIVKLEDQDCPDEAWFLTDPVVQAVTDKGVVCGMNALGSMTRADTAQWLYNLITNGVSCEQAEVSCQATEDGFFLPLACGTTATVTQGNFGATSHTGPSDYAFDFGLKQSPLVAIADGVVHRVDADTKPGDPCYNGGGKECASKANLVVLLHGDDTTSIYAHLSEVSVKLGDFIPRGVKVGLSGSTGWSTGPHAHVARQKNCDGKWCQSIAVSFADVPGGGVPVTKQKVTSMNCP